MLNISVPVVSTAEVVAGITCSAVGATVAGGIVAGRVEAGGIVAGTDAGGTTAGGVVVGGAAETGGTYGPGGGDATGIFVLVPMPGTGVVVVDVGMISKGILNISVELPSVATP